ncbi:hypothetical protein [Microlunatus sp. Gsoil 973]|jgi:hypothetical protein|uniref:DUF6912 family protein n=1 Tax=Microlunatus sp. Gsoil 973 TaxID=2672569 RepID=UPI0012B440ED|nr:hypothetical protein [Microlunatus sp. Gsoil 973]QGN32159.1 hypothetical protein GJV80_04420 [Microlunatus sp. Gsoil 973]
MIMKNAPRMMVFLPLGRDRAQAIRAAGRSEDELPAFAATPQMITAHGYRPNEREDADYAAQLYASVAGLGTSADETRLVVAADVPIARVRDNPSDADYGAIIVSGLDWSDVAAVFVDGPEAAAAVRTARKAIGSASDSGLAAILELPEIVVLTDDHELLWHNPDENWA